jgi:hypothetical protein
MAKIITEINDGIVARWSIRTKMEKGVLPNPYEIQESDLNKQLDIWDFGKVTESDIGKLVYLRNEIIQIENNEQMEKRKRNNPSINKILRFVIEVETDKSTNEKELQQTITEIINDAGLCTIVHDYSVYMVKEVQKLKK